MAMKLVTLNNGREYYVLKTQVHPRPCYDVYSAWEASSVMGPHMTITSEDGRWYGRVGTRRWDSSLPALSAERYAAFDERDRAECDEAYAAILAAYPNVAGGERRGGEITVYPGTPDSPYPGCDPEHVCVHGVLEGNHCKWC